MTSHQSNAVNDGGLPALCPEPSPGDATWEMEVRRPVRLGAGRAEPRAVTTGSCPWQRPSQARTPASRLPLPSRESSSHLTASWAPGPTGMLGARLQQAWDRAQQADGRWKETDSRSPAEFALVSRRRRTLWWRRFRSTSGSENGEGGEAPASSGYKNTASARLIKWDFGDAKCPTSKQI